MSVLTILAAGVGIWLLAEGAICALAPDLVRKIGERLSDLPAQHLISTGLGGAAFGAIVLTIAVRTA